MVSSKFPPKNNQFFLKSINLVWILLNGIFFIWFKFSMTKKETFLKKFNLKSFVKVSVEKHTLNMKIFKHFLFPSFCLWFFVIVNLWTRINYKILKHSWKLFNIFWLHQMILYKQNSNWNFFERIIVRHPIDSKHPFEMFCTTYFEEALNFTYLLVTNRNVWKICGYSQYDVLNLYFSESLLFFGWSLNFFGCHLSRINKLFKFRKLIEFLSKTW